MTPAEIYELWEGFLWRHQFGALPLAQGITWLHRLLADTDFDKVAESMGIDLEQMRGERG